MNSSPISVLMPVYNGEKYLSEAIESVLKQTFNDFEFLIINDGSTDNSEQIIKDFSRKDERVRYIENDTNLGLVKTLNRGLKLAKGMFIARMDADDICHPERLQIQLTFLTNNPDISICGSYYQIIGKENNIITLPTKNEEIKIGLLFRPELCHPSVMIRSNFLKQNSLRYNENSFPAEDYKLWIDAIKVGKLNNIPQSLLYYRLHENQITTKRHHVQLEKVNELRLKMLNILFPGFTLKQQEFHIKNFFSYPYINIHEFRDHREWCLKLNEINMSARVLDAKLFNNELFNYLRRRVYDYFVHQFSMNKYNTLICFNTLIRNFKPFLFMTHRQKAKLVKIALIKRYK